MGGPEFHIVAGIVRFRIQYGVIIPLKHQYGSLLRSGGQYNSYQQFALRQQFDVQSANDIQKHNEEIEFFTLL